LEQLNCKVIRGDREGTIPEPVDYIFDLAAYGNYYNQLDLNKTLNVNYNRVGRILANPLMKRIKGAVFTSSSTVGLAVHNGYTHTKGLMELAVTAVQARLDIPVTVLRPYTVYGIGDSPRHFIPTVFNSCINGTPMRLDPLPIHDYVWVEDLVNIYMALVEEKKEVSFTPENITNYLGTFPVPSYANFHKDRIGVTNGLAWTPYGGEVLQVEAMLMPGTGKLILTGQLGDVMKESAQAALSYARANSNKFDIPKELFTNFDLHIHLPAGAIPKDGPSAGITLLSSILSALTKRPVNCQFAMTGELNLQGEVLPIGGLKEKILAAKQEGLANIIVPRLNEQDLESIGDIKKGINIFLVDNVSEVMDKVLKIK